MRDLAAHLRHLFVVQTLGEVPDTFAVTAEHTDRLSAQADRLAQGEVLRAIDLLAAGLSAVKDGSEPRIQLELALLKAVQPQSDLSIQALLFRIEQLERRLAAASGGEEPGPVEDPAPRASRPVAQTSAVSASAAAVATEPEAEAAAEVDLDRLLALWPSVVEEVCKENQMVGAFLREARPTSLEAGRLLVCFPPGAGFSKKKVESNQQLVRGAVRTLTGAALEVRYELSELAADAEAQVVLSEDELLDRLKDEFGAKEIFDDP
jgi:DNA polymerase-3 subunit gamma/tau